MSEQLSPYQFAAVLTDLVMGTCNMRILDQTEEIFHSAGLSPHKEKLEPVDTYNFTEEGKLMFEEDDGDTIAISFVDEGGNSLQKYPSMKNVWPFTNDNE